MENNGIKFKYEKLYEYRKEKGLSQEELGSRVGVSRQAVSKWETGERMPDLNNLVSICKLFDKKFEDFIDIYGEEKSEENKAKNKFTIIKLFKLILLIIICIYFVFVIFKVVVIGIMYFKLCTNKNPENFSYKIDSNQYNVEFANGGESFQKMDIFNTLTVSYKDNVWKYTNSGKSFNNHPFELETYYYLDSENINIGEEYNINQIIDSDGVISYQYNYKNGKIYMSFKTPYEITKNDIEEFYNLSFILNPFRTFKFDFENTDLVFENNKENYEKTKISIDMKTGLISKKEEYKVDKLISTDIYSYRFNSLLEYEVFLPDEEKDLIKNSINK